MQGLMLSIGSPYGYSDSSAYSIDSRLLSQYLSSEREMKKDSNEPKEGQYADLSLRDSDTQTLTSSSEHY